MLRIESDGKLPETRPSHKTRHYVDMPFLNNLRITINSMKVVKHYLNGTDSAEWLSVAEKNVYKRMKDGNKNRG